MNPESITQILDAFKDTSELAAGIAVLYILCAYLIPYAVGIAIALKLIGTAHALLVPVIERQCVENTNNRVMRQIRDSVLPDQAGTVLGYREMELVRRTVSDFAKRDLFRNPPCQEKTGS